MQPNMSRWSRSGETGVTSRVKTASTGVGAV
jgi:hypothetical protein